jgi:alpha-1,3-fucosyltransferase 10
LKIKDEAALGDEYFANREIDKPIVLWWTPFTQDKGSMKRCGARNHTCFITNVRKYATRDETRAFLFYGTDFALHDLPLPRNTKQHEWGLIHEESPKNNYLFSFEPIMRLFNHTATFKRQSDMPLVTQYLDSVWHLESRQFLVPTAEKNRLQKEEGLAPIAYIQSDCVTPSDRDVYVKALMGHIKVDSYGSCLHNKDLPVKYMTFLFHSCFFFNLLYTFFFF